MRVFRFVAIFSALILLFSYCSFTQDKLSLSTVKAISMGGAFTSIADNYECLVWNSGAMDLNIFRSQMALNYTKYYEDTQSYGFFYIKPTINNGTFGFHINTYDYGRIERYNDIGIKLSDSIRRDYTLLAGYSKKIDIDNHLLYLPLGLGLNIKYMYSSISDYSNAKGYSYDLFAFSPISKHVNLGLAIKNLGGLKLKDKQGFEQTIENNNLRFGIAFKLSENIKTSAEIEKIPKEDLTNYSLGAEIIISGIKLRSGILIYENEVIPAGGIGLGKVSGFNMDYAVSDSKNLGLIHRISMLLPMGKDIEVKKKEVLEKKRIYERLINKFAIRIKMMNLSETGEKYLREFSRIFEAEIVKDKTIEIYERQDLSTITTEVKDQYYGIYSQEIDVQYLSKGVKGVIALIGEEIKNKLILSVKLINLEDGEILYASEPKEINFNIRNVEIKAKEEAEELLKVISTKGL